MACNKDDDTNPIDISIPCTNELIDLDTIRLNPESLEFIPYDGEESFYFKNNIGEEVKFEPLYPPISHSFRETDFELTCDDGDINNYVFTREQYAVSHKCTDLNLQFYLNVYSYNSSEYPQFVDKFTLIFHEPSLDNFIDTLIQLKVITSFKDEEELLGDEFDSYNQYEFKGEIELLDKTFNNVYKVIEPEDNLLTELYFSKEYGIVGFKDLEFRLWVFDRFE
ncbi:MAG: hypothetical protein DHS20C18_25460 [Saprospiraceae bacterium]|nr:MAG: hypothetical protein DHS20C18_25460 [Saprospiraceae bacterium]